VPVIVYEWTGSRINGREASKYHIRESGTGKRLAG
jgi:hypothetical protein